MTGKVTAHTHRTIPREASTLPGVDAADHVLSQEIGGREARPCGLRQEQYDQAPHLEVVLAVVDKAPAKKAHQLINLMDHLHIFQVVRIQCPSSVFLFYFSNSIYVSNICPSFLMASVAKSLIPVTPAPTLNT